MKDIFNFTLSPADKRRILVVTKDKNGDIDWIDAAEFAQSVGITSELYPVWLNSMQEIGAVAVSDRKTH